MESAFVFEEDEDASSAAIPSAYRLPGVLRPLNTLSSLPFQTSGNSSSFSNPSPGCVDWFRNPLPGQQLFTFVPFLQADSI